jgi:hypothetical protein
VCLRAPIGVPDARWCPKERPLGYVNRKPGPAPWSSTPGPASAPTGGRAWPRALPRHREGGLPGRGVSESAGREAPKEWRRPRIRGVGRGLPAGIPEAQPAAPGLKGGSVATKGPQPRRPRPICGGVTRPTGSATVRPGHTGPATAPQAVLGHTCQLRPKGGKERDKCWVDVCVDACVWAGCVGVTLNSSEDSVPPSFGGGAFAFS